MGGFPKVKNPRRINKGRLERLTIILKDFREGRSVQEISELRGYRKDKVYHEMYYLKDLGLLPLDFKNPSSVHTENLAEVIERRM